MQWCKSLQCATDNSLKTNAHYLHLFNACRHETSLLRKACLQTSLICNFISVRKLATRLTDVTSLEFLYSCALLCTALSDTVLFLTNRYWHMTHLHQLWEQNNNVRRDLDMNLNDAAYLKKINTFFVVVSFLKRLNDYASYIVGQHCFMWSTQTKSLLQAQLKKKIASDWKNQSDGVVFFSLSLHFAVRTFCTLSVDHACLNVDPSTWLNVSGSSWPSHHCIDANCLGASRGYSSLTASGFDLWSLFFHRHEHNISSFTISLKLQCFISRARSCYSACWWMFQSGGFQTHLTHINFAVCCWAGSVRLRLIFFLEINLFFFWK